MKSILRVTMMIGILWMPGSGLAQTTKPQILRPENQKIELPQVKPIKKLRHVQIRNEDPSDIQRNDLMPMDPSMLGTPGTPKPGPSSRPQTPKEINRK